MAFKVASAAIASRLGLGGLDEGVDALEETVGDAAVEPREDAADLRGAALPSQRRPRQLSGPHQLPLDLADEPADLVGRIRLLLLDARKQHRLLTIGEPSIEQPAADQRRRDHAREQQPRTAGLVVALEPPGTVSRWRDALPRLRTWSVRSMALLDSLNLNQSLVVVAADRVAIAR